MNLQLCGNLGSDWRRRMDEIDKKLVELLNERSHCALEIGRSNRQANSALPADSRDRSPFQRGDQQ